jgi:(S)-ureidoglycine aminohydrolase
MRAVHELLHSRTRVRRRYALMPLEGFPPSRLPAWPESEARILASPALGAAFVQYKIDLLPGQGTQQRPDGNVETFLYVLGGTINITIDQNGASLGDGGFAFVPHTSAYSVQAAKSASLLVLRKRYEPADGAATPKPLVGNQSDVRGDVYLGNDHARLQTLIPDDLRYDLAMNIFTFDPGHCLPYVETHVMEHGLLFLQGKGLYFLDEEWMEVQSGDFIWMAPYCPQTFYATGNVPARYIYYKNVNRDVEL